MESEPKSEKGKRVQILLSNFVGKSPEEAVEKLRSTSLIKVTNQDSFLGALYGQEVLDETPLNLRQHLTTTLLRVQHAMEVSCDRKKIKELVVALEMSENENVLTEILTWAERPLKTDAEGAKSIDLAPQKIGRSFASLLSKPGRPLEPRIRRITWKGGDNKRLGAFEVCGNKIIIGWSDGKIRIYNSVDLQCQTVLKDCRQGHVSCIECTCTEVIAGYADGYICTWNIETGNLIQMISNDEEHDGQWALDMRWKSPKLVVSFENSSVGIWEYSSGHTFTRLSRLKPCGGNIAHRVYLSKNNLIVMPQVSRKLNICNFQGKTVRSVSTCCGIIDMTYHNGNIIAGGVDKVLRIWDMNTGKLLKALEGHEGRIMRMESSNNFVVSVDDTGLIIIWSLEAALEGKEAQLTRLRRPAPGWSSENIGLGPHFVVSHDLEEKEVIVFDFP